MKLLKTKGFVRWANKEKISDSQLQAAAAEVEQGLACVELGGGLVKLRLARAGAGKRSGHRVLLAFKRGTRTIFLFGFSKKDRENLDIIEQNVYKHLAKYYLRISSRQLAELCQLGELSEVYDDKNKKK